MGFYSKKILPSIIDFTCRTGPATKQRQKIIPLAVGEVLEIGIGSGLNLPFYSEAVKSVTGIDPSKELWDKNSVDLDQLDFSVDVIAAGAESMPLDARRFDTVVVTYTLCSLTLIDESLAEISRVLKPGGKLLFCEHGVAPDKTTRFWQNTINPIWKRLGGGCNLNRNIPLLLEESGFGIESLDQMYIPGVKFASYNYWGEARIK